MDEEERRRKIRDFSFDNCKRGNQGFQRILLQLFGLTAHGKSSFINSVICAWFKSDYKNYANAGDSEDLRTMGRRSYSLTKNIVLVDNRGCPTMNMYETGEIFAQLDVVPTVILTYKDHQNYAGVQTMFRDIGAVQIFAIENYTEKNPKRRRETEEEVIRFLHAVICDVEFRADLPRDADQEMMGRKWFVLNYIHTRELIIQKTNLEKQKLTEKQKLEEDFRRKQEEEERQKKQRRQSLQVRLEEMERDYDRLRSQDQRQFELKMRELKNSKRTKPKN
ncbi:hypothetical protein GDO81_021033 [Engystomops pustulosus]|uniref:Uncharacterized protein n=1 Tax=Engystomops pustulosus TaxID=76066 RepID=A0AAV6ZFQ5_ENGPU|nr:hypothetical protein GDO81_021033 [Engystomops pustulosus]